MRLSVAYFDTRVGAKREAQSYKTILRETGLSGPDMLFLSDVGEELDERVRMADGVELLGRRPGAPPRGCSLAVEALLGWS